MQNLEKDDNFFLQHSQQQVRHSVQSCGPHRMSFFGLQKTTEWTNVKNWILKFSRQKRTASGEVWLTVIKSQTKIRLTCLTTHPPQEKLEDWGGTREKVQLGSTEIWTRIAGFRVQSANHYTIEPSLITGLIVTYSNEFPFTVKLQIFVRYPFSYFWLETGSHELIFVLSTASW